MNQFDDVYPFVSIIMPVRNEALWIAHSVSAVLRQNYPPERMEIIVADGLSEDDTVAIIQGLPEVSRVKIICNSRRIQAAGMNEAIQFAHGDVIIRVDGHTVVTPNYVCCCIETLRVTHADNVGGSIHFIGNTSVGCAIALASKSAFAVPAIFRIGTNPQYVDTVYMGAWPRHVFERVGLFDERFSVNEDYEFNYRIRKVGGRIYFTPKIYSEYYGQQTLTALARQYFRYGFSKPKTLLKHPQSIRIRHLVAPFFVLFIIAGVSLKQIIPPLHTLWIVGNTIYLFANLMFSVYVGQRKKLTVLLRIPWVFFLIHAAWGSGFWFGIAQLLMDRLNENSVSQS